MIRITARRDGFRRAGMAHPAAPTQYPDDRFTADQLALLQAEPRLIVELIPAEGDGAAAVDAPARGRKRKAD